MISCESAWTLAILVRNWRGRLSPGARYHAGSGGGEVIFTQAPAKAVIVVPARTPELQVNLVRGDLSFETDRIAGEHRINVVSGHVDVL
jgi:hypothetical protein